MSFPRYKSYKESGVEWLGDVPEHWVACRFSRVILAIKDGTHGTFSRMTEGKVFLSAKNVNNGRIEISDDESLITWKDHSDIVSNGFPQKGDLLLTIVGTIGRSCVYSLDEAIAFQRSVCFIRLKKSCLPQFFYFLTQSKFFQEQLQSRSKSSAQAGVYMGDVSATSIMFPTNYEEQQIIAAFLDRETAKIDALITEQQRLIELLKEKRQAVISHAITTGLNPDVPMKDSGVEWLGEVPEHWETVRLGALFKETAEPGNDELPVLSVSIHNGVSDREFEDDELERKVVRSEDRSKYKRVKVGDLVYNMMRAWQGGFGTVVVPGMVSPAYVVARPTRQIRADFIEQLLRTQQAVEELRRNSRGVTDFRLRLYWSEFKPIKVALPSIKEQHDIMEFLDRETAKFDELTTEAERAINFLQEHRMALISAAVTGKIDVRRLI